MMMVPQDSVSAEETRRLRERDAALRALRDSLNNAPVIPPPAAPARAVPEQRIPMKKDPVVKPEGQND